ncbi:MAG: hypothetical protein F6K21_12315 [Symploca sp. SIO2D2]|nr:hypothetical protein [Symploca sp. SIO2D2]
MLSSLLDNAIASYYLRNQQSFVWNETNLSRQLRSTLINLFTNYQGRIPFIYILEAIGFCNNYPFRPYRRTPIPLLNILPPNRE